MEQLDEGEVLVGKATGNKQAYDDDITITSSGRNKFYCTNCSKKRIHCIHGTKTKNGPTEMLKDTCSNDVCECRCRRYYEARNGKLLPLDTIDTTSAWDEEMPRDPKTDLLIQQINQAYLDSKKIVKITLPLAIPE